MSRQPEFSRDIDQVLEYLGLGDRSGLASLHRAQDLQSWLLHREAVRMLGADPSLVKRAETTLALWLLGADSNTRPLMNRWAEILRAADWDAVLANTDEAQQLRQASPLAGLLPEDLRLGILAYVRQLTREG